MNSFKTGPRNHPKVGFARASRILPIPAQQIPLTLSHVNPGFPFTLRYHPKGGDVLFQLGFGLSDVAVEELPDSPKLPCHELANASDLGGTGIWLGAEE